MQVDEQIDEQKPMVETKFCGMIQSTAAISPADKIQVSI